MKKHLNIFLFIFLLSATLMVASCGVVENINGSTNEGEIVVENNSNYETITVCGVISGSEMDMGGMTGGNTTSSVKKDDERPSGNPSEDPSPSMDNQSVGTVENCTNTGNLSVNNNNYELQATELSIEVSGIVNKCKEVKDCKNEGQFTTDGNASKYKIETYDITKEKEEQNN